jgi:hypothetical protein
MRIRSRTLLFALAMLIVASLSVAQTFTGSIRCTVADQTGALLPGAKITVSDVNTGFTRSTVGGSGGEFDFSGLPIGTYRVEAVATGFTRGIQTGLELHVNDIRIVQFKLPIGTVAEQVMVEANSVAVESQTGQVAGLVDGTQVRELPMNGRNFMQLTQLTPGVSAGSSFNSTSKGLGGSVNMSVSGSWGNGNVWLLDGANNNDYGSNRTILVYPSIDNIEEFKILRNSYGPEFGQAAGGVVNIVTRGGTNKLHGSVYYFGRNDALNARDWFLANADQPIGKLRRNDFGYTLGGPVKKDKLFFFWSQEWNREIRGFTRTSLVPTVEEKQGNFTGCVTTARPTNPLTGAPISNLSTLNAAGKSYLKIFPDPNTADPCASTNWIKSVGSSDNWREDSIRVDYNLNLRNSLMFRFSNDSWTNPSPNAGGYFGLWGDDPFPNIESSWSQPSRSLSAKLTTTLGSNMVNEFQFSWSWNAINTSFGGDQSLNSEITTAIPAIFADQKSAGKDLAYPVYWGSPYGNLWSESPWHNRQSLINFRDNFSKAVGKHTFKTGLYYATNLKDEMMGGGGFSEAVQFYATRGPIDPATGVAVGHGTGNWVADILSPNYIFGFNETAKARLGPIRWHDVEFYGGDSWRVTPRLTLEYGFRWSFFPEPVFANNQISSFSPAVFNPTLNSACNGLLLPPGSTACSSLNLPGSAFADASSIRSSSNHLIAPRLGFAWDPTGAGKWVVRGGVGQFFQRERVNALLGLGNQAPFVASTGATDDGGRYLDSAVAPFAGAFTSGLGSPSFGVATDAHVPNSWQWNLTVERELAKGVKLETSYVGNRGVHQVSAYNANQGSRYAGLGQVWMYADTANSNYHGLQMGFTGRTGQVLQWQGAYTWSKLIADSSMNWFGEIQNGKQDAITDINNPRLDRGLSQMNRPHVFAFNVVYNLPKLAGSNDLVKHAFGGWEVATIITAGTGSSVSVFNGQDGRFDIGNTGTPDNQRPNLVAGASCSVSGSDPSHILNPSAFTLPSSGFGNAPRGVCLGPGYSNADLALYKNFNVFGGSKLLHEGMKIQFRMEAFNAFNHAQFQLPVNNNLNFDSHGVPSSNFGVANQVRPGREIQYALKFIF